MPETKTKLLALIAWEYGPNAAGALLVTTASLTPMTTTQKQKHKIAYIYTHVQKSEPLASGPFI